MSDLRELLSHPEIPDQETLEKAGLDPAIAASLIQRLTHNNPKEEISLEETAGKLISAKNYMIPESKQPSSPESLHQSTTIRRYIIPIILGIATIIVLFIILNKSSSQDQETPKREYRYVMVNELTFRTSNNFRSKSNKHDYTLTFGTKLEILGQRDGKGIKVYDGANNGYVSYIYTCSKQELETLLAIMEGGYLPQQYNNTRFLWGIIQYFKQQNWITTTPDKFAPQKQEKPAWTIPNRKFSHIYHQSDQEYQNGVRVRFSKDDLKAGKVVIVENQSTKKAKLLYLNYNHDSDDIAPVIDAWNIPIGYAIRYIKKKETKNAFYLSEYQKILPSNAVLLAKEDNPSKFLLMYKQASSFIIIKKTYDFASPYNHHTGD